MSGYLGTKAVLLSTTAATVSGSSTVGAGLTVDNDGATVLTVDRATSDGTIIDVQRGGTSTATIGVSAGDDVYFAGATGSTKGIYFNANGLLPATTGGGASDGTVDIGENITRWKDLYLSGGVYLGGTGSANLLDDYEEGTFTTTCSSGGYTIAAQHSRYVKIGSLVQINAYISFSAVNAASNSIVVLGGLPFTSTSFDGGLYYTGVGREDSVAGDIFVVQQTRGTTTWSFNSMDGVTVNSNQTIVAGRNYSLSLTYRA